MNKKDIQKRQYPSRITNAKGYCGELGRMGWLHGFSGSGFCYVEWDDKDELDVVGSHCFKFIKSQTKHPPSPHP